MGKTIPTQVKTIHVGEMPNDRVLYVPFEFYVNGKDLDASSDDLFQDFQNLTPSIAKFFPGSTPSNGIRIEAVPGAVGLAQCKAIYGNQAGVFEKLIEVNVVPAGSVTLYVRRSSFDYLSIYDAFYE